VSRGPSNKTLVFPSGSSGGGGGGAPVDAQYVTLATDPGLTAERVLTGEATVISITDGGANNPVTVGLTAAGVTDAKLALMPANSVKVNATAAVAAPTNLAVGTDTVLGRVAGNIVAALLTTSQKYGVGTVYVIGGHPPMVSVDFPVWGVKRIAATYLKPCTREVAP